MSTFIFCGCFNKKIEIKNTKSFYYYYSVSNAKDGSYLFKLNLEEDKFVAYYKGEGISEEDSIKKEINNDKVLELEQILTKYKIYKWNGFKKSNKRILDGNSFSLNYKTENNSIEASGYMSYPNGYKEFKEEIKKWYTELFKEEIEKIH